MINGFQIAIDDVLQFDYTNQEGINGRCAATVKKIWFGSTQWHPEPGIMIEAIDLARNITRYFYAMDMTNIKKVI